MKILAGGDLHSDSSLAENLAKKAANEKVDLVILCGDIAHFDDLKPNMLKPFLDKKQSVVFIPGNHDSMPTADFISAQYGIKNIHGTSLVYDKLGIFACGGANVGILKFSEDEIFNYLNDAHSEIKDKVEKKVMVTHVHPSNTNMERFSNFIPGSSGVRRAITEFKPDLAICCHIHEAEGIEEIVDGTRVINVGKSGHVFEF